MLAIANNDHFRADGKPERVAELARNGKRSLAGLPGRAPWPGSG